ncbi:hypothetical protein Bpfe_001921 [Biomphalaria pfeifferi]|uniref:Uncharacterized protein n=1 Tax=Biomphalaria pfeifferi TaxID=112525 RepID=A0AAD8FM35_BIOPF|nr:hypothetical protein Bpfe_001921 [Biomphalaria pfeifferi]
MSFLVAILPLACSFYIGPDYDAPDQKFLSRNAYGQLQSFDVSHEQKYVRNAYGGVSAVRVIEFLDPDIYHRPGPVYLPPHFDIAPVPLVPLAPRFPVPQHHHFDYHFCE